MLDRWRTRVVVLILMQTTLLLKAVVRRMKMVVHVLRKRMVLIEAETMRALPLL